jgi:transposase-like protein
MRRPRRNHSPEFKAKVALAALKGDKTLAELAEQFDLFPIQISEWENQLAESAGLVFSKAKQPTTSLRDIDQINLAFCILVRHPGQR